ncbi:MAG: phosphatidate cytidylyltransferase [Myxococcota bacterium]
MMTRLLAAGVGLAIILPAIVLGGVVAAEVLVGIAGLIITIEYAYMAYPDDKVVMSVVQIIAVVGVSATVLHVPQYGLVTTIALVTGVLALQTLRPGEDLERSADRAGRLVLGTGWVVLLTSLVLLRREEHGLAWVFLVLEIAWIGDTGAYFAGRFFGRTPLYERISPKKTWEGVAGGVVAATIGVFVVRELGELPLTNVECLVIGPILTLVGVLGDLCESMLKRSFSVKDSGWIMPGHGGLLDRVDSVLFVGPWLYAWVRIMEA